MLTAGGSPMKKIILVRHGRAAKRQDEHLDFKRSLVKKGEKETEMMARALKKESFKPDLIISSPADRALETAHIYARKLGYPLKRIRLEDVLYQSSVKQSILQMIQAITDEYESIMLFGHNPSLSDLVRELVPDFRYTIPKSGVAGIEFTAGNWKGVNKAKGRLVLFDYPVTKKQKAQVGKKIQQELSKKLSRAIATVIQKTDPSVRTKMEPVIQQASHQLSGQFIKLADHLIIQTLSNMKLKSGEPDEDTARPVPAQRKKPNPVKKTDAGKATK
jgi:phosphohistidine phosphatase